MLHCEMDELADQIKQEAKLVEELRQRVFDIHAKLKPYRTERNRLLSLLKMTYAVVVRIDPELFWPRDKWHDGMAVVAIYRDSMVIGRDERRGLFRELDGLNVHFGRINEDIRVAGVELANAERVLSGLRKEFERKQKKKR
jgi:hypothetical protein